MITLCSGIFKIFELKVVLSCDLFILIFFNFDSNIWKILFFHVKLFIKFIVNHDHLLSRLISRGLDKVFNIWFLSGTHQICFAVKFKEKPN